MNELIIQQIYDSYMLLAESGSIPPVTDYSKECLEHFKTILDGDLRSIINKLIEHNRDPVVRARKQLLYEKKELRLLGIKSIDDCEDNVKNALDLMFRKNFSVITKEQLERKAAQKKQKSDLKRQEEEEAMQEQMNQLSPSHQSKPANELRVKKKME